MWRYFGEVTQGLPGSSLLIGTPVILDLTVDTENHATFRGGPAPPNAGAYAFDSRYTIGSATIQITGDIGPNWDNQFGFPATGATWAYMLLGQTTPIAGTAYHPRFACDIFLGGLCDSRYGLGYGFIGPANPASPAIAALPIVPSFNFYDAGVLGFDFVGQVKVRFTSSQPIPEPSTLTPVGIVSAGIVMGRRWRRHNRPDRTNPDVAGRSPVARVASVE
jgi:hypothetical protein